MCSVYKYLLTGVYKKSCLSHTQLKAVRANVYGILVTVLLSPLPGTKLYSLASSNIIHVPDAGFQEGSHWSYVYYQ